MLVQCQYGAENMRLLHNGGPGVDIGDLCTIHCKVKLLQHEFGAGKGGTNANNVRYMCHCELL